jgi:hypothetical protein
MQHASSQKGKENQLKGKHSSSCFAIFSPRSNITPWPIRVSVRSLDQASSLPARFFPPKPSLIDGKFFTNTHDECRWQQRQQKNGDFMGFCLKVAGVNLK